MIIKVKTLEMGEFEVVKRELITGGVYFRLKEIKKGQTMRNSKKLKPLLGKDCSVFLQFRESK